MLREQENSHPEWPLPLIPKSRVWVNLPWKPTVLVSYCWGNKLLWTWWLKTTQIYYLTVLEVRHLKWVLLSKNQNEFWFIWIKWILIWIKWILIHLNQMNQWMKQDFILLEALGDHPFPCLSQFRGCPYSMACGLLPASNCIIAISASVVTPPSLTLLPPSFPYKDPCDYTGSTRIIQDNLPISRSLI